MTMCRLQGLRSKFRKLVVDPLFFGQKGYKGLLKQLKDKMTAFEFVYTLIAFHFSLKNNNICTCFQSDFWCGGSIAVSKNTSKWHQFSFTLDFFGGIRVPI